MLVIRKRVSLKSLMPTRVHALKRMRASNVHLHTEKELAFQADEALFGRVSTSAYPFILAKARDINACPHAGKDGDRSFEDIRPMPEETNQNDDHDGRSQPLSTTETKDHGISHSATENRGHVSVVPHAEQADAVNESRQGHQDAEKKGETCIQRKGESQTPSATERGGDGAGLLRDQTEQLKGGAVLRRLQPLLDSFIREDKQRSGALPAEVFRDILTEGHGGLWPGIGSPKSRNDCCDAGHGGSGLTRHSGND